MLRSGDRLAAVDSGISSARSTGTVPWSATSTTAVPWNSGDEHHDAEPDWRSGEQPPVGEENADPLARDSNWSRPVPPAESGAVDSSWRAAEVVRIEETWGRDAVIL